MAATKEAAIVVVQNAILKGLFQVQKKHQETCGGQPAADCLTSMDAALRALDEAAVEDGLSLPAGCLPLPDASGSQSGEEGCTPGAPTDPLVLNLLPAWAALVKNLS